MASFDKAIPPGGEGKITVKIDTKGYSGNKLWTTRIYSDDPAAQKSAVKIRAKVNAPIQLSSDRVYLRVTEGDRMTRMVEIHANLPTPLTLTPETFDLDGKVDYSMEEIEKGRTYRLRFTNVPASAQNFNGSLVLKTNYPERPDLSVRIIVSILEKKGDKTALLRKPE